MAKAKKYYWLKLVEGFFTTKPLKKLRKIAGGDTYTIIYLKLQLLSLSGEGMLYYEGVEDDFIEELALAIDEEVDNVRFTVLFLEKCGLLEIINDGEILLTAVPYAIGKETDSAQRVREHRERKKQQKALQCNTDVTSGNTEIEKDKEIDTEKETETNKKKVSKKSSFDAIITNYAMRFELPVCDEIADLLGEWLKVRKAKRAAMTDRAIQMNINKLDDLAAKSNLTVVEYLKEVICRGWAAFFVINNYDNKRKEPVPKWLGREEKNDAIVDELEEMLLQEVHNTKTVANCPELAAKAEKVKKMLQG